ncbi:MAG: glucose-6-phosphate isomerase, partial [Lentisphaeria bacterium]
MKEKFIDPTTGFSLDISGLSSIKSANLANILAKFDRVKTQMERIEAGEIKNPDEKRQVTHFTDRISYPDSELFSSVENFAFDVRNGDILGCTNKPFKNVVINGIGGSALGPQLMNFAINGPYWNELSAEKRDNWLRIYFTDNTDSSGITDVIAAVDLEETMILSISKSGGTRETYNNMKAFESVYAKAGLNFTKNAVAITMEGSELDRYSKSQNWLKVFPMAESIGGRTSETSIVGHLPAALTGINFSNFLAGATYMDELTRETTVENNPAYILATCWYAAGNGKGDKNMVIVPYS